MAVNGVMDYQPKNCYEFGPFRLDSAERRLLRNGETVPLKPKAFDLLLVLVQNHGHLLEKEELLRSIWPDTIVEEANLAYNISLIRKALGNGRNGDCYIETVPRYGYRFVESVREVEKKTTYIATAESSVERGLAQADGVVWRRVALVLLAVALIAILGIGLYLSFKPQL